MKLIFWPKDTVYKIFSSIQKLPRGKKVSILIKKWNPFYENIWWWKQLIQVLKDKQIDFIFICDEDTERYFISLGVWCVAKKNYIKSFTQFLKKLFAQNYFYQKTLIQKRSWLWYLIVLIEIGFVIWIFNLFYDFISHRAVVYIKPAYHVETLVYNFLIYTWDFKSTKEKIAIPYYRKVLNVNQTLTLSVSNLKYLTSPAHWQVKIYNYTNKDISFKAWTKFITEDWLIFRSKYWFRLPPAKDWKPWVGYTTLVALDRDINWDIIWKRGNIWSGCQLYILKYWPSIDLHKIYAIPVQQFEWWETIGKGVVWKKDIDTLKEKLRNVFKANLVNYILQDLGKGKNKVFLNFPQFIEYKIINYIFDAKPWDVRAVVNWTIEGQIIYHYLLWNEIKIWFEKYIKERSLDTQKVVDLDKNSLVLLDYYPITKKVWLLPIQVDIIKWYNFDVDKSWLIDKIKSEIAWKTKNEAEK